jgi:hypothetical protein
MATGRIAKVATAAQLKQNALLDPYSRAPGLSGHAARQRLRMPG